MDYKIGDRVRVYHIPFSSDHIDLKDYQEGVIVLIEPWMESTPHYYYHIEKIVIGKKVIRRDKTIKAEYVRNKYGFFEELGDFYHEKSASGERYVFHLEQKASKVNTSVPDPPAFVNL